MSCPFEYVKRSSLDPVKGIVLDRAQPPNEDQGQGQRSQNGKPANPTDGTTNGRKIEVQGDDMKVTVDDQSQGRVDTPVPNAGER